MKINVTKIDTLQSALDTAQKGCTARTVNGADIACLIEDIEARLTGLLPKAYWRGLQFDCDPNGQSFPSSYKYTPESTRIRLEHGASGWFITRLYRGPCRGVTQHIQPVNLEDREEQILAYLSSPRAWM